MTVAARHPSLEVPVPSRPRSAIRSAAALLVLGLLFAACNGGSPSPSAAASVASPDASASSPSTGPSAAPTKLVVGLGFIPSVQFAPFYLADQAGYYAEAGLQVEFQNKIDPDLVTLVGQGAIDIGISDGTSVIPAVSQGIPIRYVATLYGKFPSIVFAKASSGIKTAADLKGKKIGIPGRYGSSWVMLQALLKSAGMTPDDVTIVEYPDFGQGTAVTAGAVDAATGFINNEPVQLELTGESASVLQIDDITPLPGPGLIAGVSTLQSKRAALAAFVGATLRAMRDIGTNPESGLDAAIKAVPDLAKARETQSAILSATIDAWTGTVQQADGLGALDPTGWTASIAYMTSLGLVAKPVTLVDVLDPGLLTQGN
jgi:NitT/TauT family transport system substrate-binding protein